ncbi:MAG: hypothetical protein ABH871_08495 [Pseudomonadota bacterium]
MAEKVSPKNDSAQAYNACEEAGKPGSTNNNTCRKMIDVCLSEPAGTYTLVTDAGPITLKEQDSCKSTAVTLASMNYKLVSYKVKPAKTPKPKARNQPKASKPEPSNSDKPNDTAPPNSPAPVTQYDECKSIGNTDTKMNKACNEYVNICMTKPKGPYRLFTTVGSIKAADQKSCVEIATTLASMGYERKISEDQPKHKKESDQPAKPNDSDKSTSSSDPVGGFRLRKSFATINLRLRVTGDRYTHERRTLLFEGGKGIPIVLKYSVKRKEGGAYVMRYTVLKGGKAIDGEQSLIFTATAGKINLGFEVALKRAGDFGDIESIRIVNLSDQ